jgi:acetyltransferase-like isoleucine patch superfamily enzyme
MKKTIFAVSIFLFSGCSIMSGIMDKGAEINDEALVSSEFIICSGASVGAIERRYNTVELLEARKTLCDKDIIVIEP